MNKNKAQYLFYLTVESENGVDTFGPYAKPSEVNVQANIVHETTDNPCFEHALNLKTLVMTTQVIEKAHPTSESKE